MDRKERREEMLPIKPYQGLKVTKVTEESQGLLEYRV